MMSLENEDRICGDKAPESVRKSQNGSKISYTREFLLSLSGLDICKNLPRGFDRSILSELEDASGTQDRPRIPGSSPLQGFRRNDYGSSPPTKGETGNYARGGYGRWDRSSIGRSDRDSDSQSDRDLDSGRRYASQSRRSWQSYEHDGLLGSGSFPRPSGYVAGISAPKNQPTDGCQLNKSNEPYHPPRPYKPVSHLRRDTTDSYNDETFGSIECASQDREEEEKKRRASFELMRKEQQKALHDKKRLNEDKHKDDHVLDAMLLPEDKKEESRPVEELDVSITVPVSSNDTSKSSFPSQVPAARPLVPPGFTNSLLEKSSTSNSSIHIHPIEVGNSEMGDNLLYEKVNPLQNGTLVDQGKQLTLEKKSSEHHPQDRSIHELFPGKVEKVVNSLLAVEVLNKIPGMDNHLCGTSSLSDAQKFLADTDITELNTKVLSESNQNNSNPILEKLFNSALAVTVGGDSGLAEHHESKQDDLQRAGSVQSSKFAHWFLEEEKKPTNVLSPSNLLSLIVSADKGGAEVSDVGTPMHILPELSYSTFEFSNGTITSNMPATTTGISEQLYSGPKQEVPAVLTCEDLEQTILSECREKGPILQMPDSGRDASSAKMEHPKAVVDNCASQHLFSLLQKGTGIPTSGIDSESVKKLNASEIGNSNTILPEKSTQTNTNIIHNSGKTLTLETLFGTAFMKQLQSVEAPVSIQRVPLEAERIDVFEPQGLSFPIVEDELLPGRINEARSNRTSQETNISNHRQKTELDKLDNWLGLDDPQIIVDSSNLPPGAATKHNGVRQALEIQLPEEESLITTGDPVNHLTGNAGKGEFLSSSTPVDIVRKFAALNAISKDEHPRAGQDGQAFVRGGLYDLMEPEVTYSNLHSQTPYQFHPSQISHGRPMFNPLDSHPSHMNSQMKFIAPQSITHHDGSPNHQLPGNMLRSPFRHRNPSPGFDLPVQRPMLQQMQMPGNFPPPHVLHEFHSGGPLAPHRSNQATRLMQEPNPMQGFSFGHRQSNIGSLGVSLPVADVNNGGGNHPEALQRLIEMDLRANAKHNHPFVGGHNQGGMYGHELDKRFRYNR